MATRMTAITGYEWGIGNRYDPTDPHRCNMTEDEARTWIKEWREAGGDLETFHVIRRPVGRWEWL